MAKVLGPEAYGLAVLVLSVPALVFAVADSHSRDVSVRYLAEFDSKNELARAARYVRFAYGFDAFVVLVTMALLLVVARPLTRLVTGSGDHAALVLLAAAPYLPYALANTSWAVLAATDSFGLIARIEAGTSLVRCVLSVALVLAGFGVHGVIWGHVVGLSVIGIALAVAAVPVARGRWRSEGTCVQGVLRDVLPGILRFLLYSNVNGTVGLVTKRLDYAVLGALQGPESVAFYRIAKSAASVWGFVQVPLQAAIYPRFARLQGEATADARRQLVGRLALRVGAPLGLAVLLTVLVIPAVIDMVLGAAYAAAVIPAQVLLASAAAGAGCFWLRPFFLSSGGHGLWTAISAGTSAAFLVIALPLASAAGVLGMAIGFTAVNLLAVAVLVVVAVGRLWPRTAPELRSFLGPERF